MANIIPNYMQQVNAQNWAEGLGSVVQALNNPQAFANADLLRAKKAEIESSIAYQQGKLGLEKQETGAHVNAFNATAEKERQQGALYAADIKLRNQQYDSRDNLGTTYRNAGVESPMADLLAAQAQASGPSTGSEDFTKSYVQLVRPDPVKIAPGETVQFAVGPNGERIDPRDTRGVGGSAPVPQISVPEAQLSPAQGGLGLGSMLGNQRQGLVSSGVGAYTAPGSVTRSMTPFQKAKDEKWAGIIAENESKGGTVDIDNNLSKIQNAVDLLKNAKTTTGVSGPVTGILPDIVNRGIGNNAAVDARQSMESAVSDTLRATLGAAFTAEEGKRTLKLAYDPTAPDTENIRRATLLQNLLKAKAQTIKDAQDYGNNMGTMDGFKPTPIGSHKDLNDQLEAAIKSPKAASQEKFTVGQAYTSNGVTKIYRGGGKWESAQ